MAPDAAVEALAERIRAAASARRALCIRGGGSKEFYGGESKGEVLDARGCAGIVSYEPTELVVTARGGTPLAELEAALAEKGQMLAFEPPHFGAAATQPPSVARRPVRCAISCSECRSSTGAGDCSCSVGR